MAYRNKVYVAFDGDEDMLYYRMLQAWSENDEIDFDINNAHDLNTARDSSQAESIKAQLRERMKNSKVMLLLIGAKTKNLTGFVKWEIESARRRDLPIIVVNINKKRRYDADRCHKAVLDGDVYTVHISYEQKIIKFALENFPADYAANKAGRGATCYYKDSVYEKLGL